MSHSYVGNIRFKTNKTNNFLAMCEAYWRLQTYYHIPDKKGHVQSILLLCVEIDNIFTSTTINMNVAIDSRVYSIAKFEVDIMDHLERNKTKVLC